MSPHERYRKLLREIAPAGPAALSVLLATAPAPAHGGQESATQPAGVADRLAAIRGAVSDLVAPAADNATPEQKLAWSNVVTTWSNVTNTWNNFSAAGSALGAAGSLLGVAGALLQLLPSGQTDCESVKVQFRQAWQAVEAEAKAKFRELGIPTGEPAPENSCKAFGYLQWARQRANSLIAEWRPVAEACEANFSSGVQKAFADVDPGITKVGQQCQQYTAQHPAAAPAVAASPPPRPVAPAKIDETQARAEFDQGQAAFNAGNCAAAVGYFTSAASLTASYGSTYTGWRDRAATCAQHPATTASAAPAPAQPTQLYVQGCGTRPPASDVTGLGPAQPGTVANPGPAIPCPVIPQQTVRPAPTGVAPPGTAAVVADSRPGITPQQAAEAEILANTPQYTNAPQLTPPSQPVPPAAKPDPETQAQALLAQGQDALCLSSPPRPSCTPDCVNGPGLIAQAVALSSYKAEYTAWFEKAKQRCANLQQLAAASQGSATTSQPASTIPANNDCIKPPQSKQMGFAGSLPGQTVWQTWVFASNYQNCPREPQITWTDPQGNKNGPAYVTRGGFPIDTNGGPPVITVVP